MKHHVVQLKIVLPPWFKRMLQNSSVGDISIVIEHISRDIYIHVYIWVATYFRQVTLKQEHISTNANFFALRLRSGFNT